MTEQYSDDTCICKAETIDSECPRHKHLIKYGTNADGVKSYEQIQKEKAEADRY